MVFPHRTTGSLWPTFVPAWDVSLTVRQIQALSYKIYLCTPPLPFRRPPPQSNYLLTTVLEVSKSSFKAVVFHWRSKLLPPNYILKSLLQWQSIVKVHRVFPSNWKKTASSRSFQFHWVQVGDSGEVVTPFMQVGTYPTRNFATLGPSELQPPFTGAYCQSFYLSSSLYRTGQASVSIPHFTTLQRPVFLLNSRHPSLRANKSNFKTWFVPPYSEVTGSICRVPSTWFSHCLSVLHLPTCVGLRYGVFFFSCFLEIFQKRY
jgi:hypothetical protein